MAELSQSDKSVKLSGKSRDQSNCLGEAETGRAASKRLRPTELPGKDSLQPAELPAACVVCYRVPALGVCHPCSGGL